MQLARQVNANPGTTLSQEITAVAKKYETLPDSTKTQFSDCASAFSLEQLDEGLDAFISILTQFETQQFSELPQTILVECGARLAEFGATRIEYAVLALHVLNTYE